MVKRFLDEDYPSLLSWYEMHKQPVPALVDLPTYGLIEKDVAAGFLILTDARLGILEFYISNPKSSIKERNQALDTITEGLLSYGSKFGLKYFKCDTKLVSIGQRAMRHGLEFMGNYSSYFRKDN